MAHTGKAHMTGLKRALAALTSGTLKAVLMTSSYVPDYDSDEFMSALAAYELNYGNGDTNGYYAGHGNTGRKTLANASLTVTAGSVKFDADDITWSSLGAALPDVYGILIIFEGTTDDTDATVMAYIDLDPIVSPDGNDLNFQFPSAGAVLYGQGTVVPIV